MPATELRPSRYNFMVPVETGVLVYNVSSGALLRLSGSDACELGERLVRHGRPFDGELVGDDTLGHLARGAFLVPVEKDEVGEVRERYWRARDETPLVLTLTTTMDCNLGCYYCYEERSDDRLELHDVDAVVALAEQRLTEGGRRSLHVDWYGGEPLLNAGFIEAASPALQAMCARRKVAYAASIISNGTAWPDDASAFVRRHRIRQVQISFDGMRANHDRRRRYRKGRKPEPGASSFDRAAELVGRLLDHVRVDVRFNLDRGNQGDLLPFIRFMRERGWFDRRFPAVFQPARLSSYSEHSGFMRKWEMDKEEYDRLRLVARTELEGEAPVQESEAPDGLPLPKSSVCAALANGSVVVGADMRTYHCGLQVGETHRAVGSARPRSPRELPVFRPDDGAWWRTFDPTEQPNCSRCSFLPICWGGCAKKHLEGDTHALAEMGVYWRANLPRLIATAAGATPPPGFAYTEREQFRAEAEAPGSPA